MCIKKGISNGHTYLVFAQSYRINEKVKYKTIEKIGYLDNLEKHYDDPIAHFKEITKQKLQEFSPEFTT